MRNRIKVLLIADCPKPLGNIKGGVESVTANLIDGLSQKEIDVTVLSMKGNLKENSEVSIADNIRVLYQKYSVNEKLRLLEFFYFGVKKIQKVIDDIKPDIIHLQGTGPILFYLRKLNKKRVVITQHAIFKEELKHQVGIRNKLKFKYKSTIEKLLLPRFNNFIFISEYNEKIFYNNFVSNKNKHVLTKRISNPVKREMFNTKKNTANNRLLYTGVINKRKNLKMLVEAISELRSQDVFFHLDVLGGAKEASYYDSIIRFCEEKQLQDAIKFHGWVKQDVIKDYLDLCSIFILPSKQETLPVSIAEALSAGRVAVVSEVGGVNEMIDDNQSGFLFRKNDKENLKSILKRLHSNQNLVDKISEKAKQSAMKRYHPDSVAEKTINFYREVINSF